MEISRHYNDEKIDCQELLSVLHESFEERTQQGIEFSCSSVTLAQMKDGIKDAYVVIAKDNENIIGYARLIVSNNKAHFGPIAIQSSYKSKGVGSLLFKEIDSISVENKLEYIESDTATKAISSVKFHLKNGFKLFGLASYKNTNYYSYVFRKYYNHSSYTNFYCMLHYYVSMVKCRLLYNKYGDLSMIGKMFTK